MAKTKTPTKKSTKKSVKKDTIKKLKIVIEAELDGSTMQVKTSFSGYTPRPVINEVLTSVLESLNPDLE